MRTLLGPVVLSVGLLGRLFQCFRDGFLSFSVLLLWLVFVGVTSGNCCLDRVDWFCVHLGSSFSGL